MRRPGPVAAIATGLLHWGPVAGLAAVAAVQPQAANGSFVIRLSIYCINRSGRRSFGVLPSSRPICRTHDTMCFHLD